MALAPQDAAISEKKKAKQNKKIPLIYMCVFFKATLCSMFLQICLYDIDKIKLVFWREGGRDFDEREL